MCFSIQNCARAGRLQTRTEIFSGFKESDMALGTLEERQIEWSQTDWGRMKKLDNEWKRDQTTPARPVMNFSRVVDLDLGRFSPVPNPGASPTDMLPYEPFNTVAQARKRFIGACCLVGKEDLPGCNCTLRDLPRMPS